MNLSNRLCNPTPFTVEIRWHAGIEIKIEPDSYVDLDVNQMDDFRDGKPGSEEVQLTMRQLGIFLRDADRSYEAQSLEAIQGAIGAKEARYNEVVQNLRKTRAAQGINDNVEAFDETLRHMGVARLKEDIEVLKKRADFLQPHVVAEEQKVAIHQQLDPHRTLVFLDPPKVFPTKLALQMFLNDPGNAKVKAEYEEWLAAYEEELAREDNAGLGAV